MDRTLSRGRFSYRMDALGAVCACLFIGIGVYMILWGACLPALLAGLGLGGMLSIFGASLLRRRFKRREAAARRAIGGALLLDRLLIARRSEANFQAAAMLSAHHLCRLERVCERGVICRVKEETTLVSFLQKHPSLPLGPDEVAAFRRDMREENVSCGILCAPCAALPAAREQAGRMNITLFDREKMLRVAGSLSPATDAQLASLAPRRGRLLTRDKAARFFLYGGMFLSVYLVFGGLPSIISGGACLFLGLVCRLRRAEQARVVSVR